ncbi:hypothetical protein [Ralstonia flatus]|uniref:hypothetical protein n=1 Tax=Ralstonia flatus TaxID=3058601 RepID=UPI0019CF7F9C|nr:hypothetical protein [Ralstonia sp. LMG 32965]MBN6210405.1 hypothetical protein [Ralstonia pickettii]
MDCSTTPEYQPGASADGLTEPDARQLHAHDDPQPEPMTCIDDAAHRPTWEGKP